MRQVSDRDVVVFYADLACTLRHATRRYAYVGDLRYSFTLDGDITAVHRKHEWSSGAVQWEDCDQSEAKS